MYLNKNNGVIMLEVVMLLNVLLILIVLSSKMIIANVSKFSLYEIKEDILTLSSEEYELLNEVKESVLKDNEIIKILKQYKEDRNLEFQYIFSKNNNMQFIIKENEMFIKEDDLRSYESIRKINVIVKEDKNKTEIIFIPTLYKYKKEI
ncbi:MAG: hypothetical protein ACLU6S_03355 [Clostridium sp.]|uniref:hypothetical protein n=1 Tax=Clostridium sp. TaxID=1506 RepID=UPI00399A2014